MAVTGKSLAAVANLQPTIWAKEVGLAATNRRIMADLVDRVDFSGPGSTMNFEQLPDITATQVASGSSIGTPVTPTTLPTFTQVQLVPLFAYVFVQIERDLMNRWLPATEAAVQKRMGISLANQVEIDIAKLVSSTLATNQFGSAATTFDVATMVQTMGSIWATGGDLVTQGVDQAHAIYHPLVWDNMLSVGVASGTPFLSAATRGEANGPAISGRLKTVFGFDVDFTAHIQLNTAQPQNLLFTQGAILLGMKEEPEILIQPFEMSTKIISVIDYGVALLWPVLAGRHWCQS